MSDQSDLPRVIVTRGFVNICTMQVCAAADATDEEILAACNRENVSGTSLGWTSVVRADAEHPQADPVTCEKYPERRHFLVRC